MIGLLFLEKKYLFITKFLYEINIKIKIIKIKRMK